MTIGSVRYKQMKENGIKAVTIRMTKEEKEELDKAVRLSGVKKEQCVVIEDSTNGIQAAKSAGIYCIGYKSRNSKNQEYLLADQIIEHFSEIRI